MFDEHGRCVASGGLRSAVNPPNQRYRLIQPELDYEAIHGRITKHLGGRATNLSDFADRAQLLLQRLRSAEGTGNITNGVYIPFMLSGTAEGDIGRKLEDVFLPALAQSYQSQFPRYGFKNELHERLVGKLRIVAGTRHERLIAAMERGAVVGWYFPMCLAGYSVDADREQLGNLPEEFMLAGGYDATAALIGSPQLCLNSEGYSPQLDLAALQGQEAGYGYHFAAYGHNLTFNGRHHLGHASDYCGGGLTVID